MVLAMSIAATGMGAQQTRIDIIAANIANSGTTAYGGRLGSFGEMISQNLIQAGGSTTNQSTSSPTGAQIPLGVRLLGITRDTSQGALSATGGPLDLAFQGRGYFTVNLPDGSSAYTRAGNFSLSSSGTIVTPDGYTVAPGITVPNNATQIIVDKTGQVSVTLPGSNTPSVLGTLSMTMFPNEGGLEAIGDNLYKQTEASGNPVTGTANTGGFGAVQQGFLENSNVNTIKSITDLIEAQRIFELNSKVITAADQTLSNIAHLKG